MSNPYFSMKRVAQDNSDPIFEIARVKFDELGRELKIGGFISNYTLSEHNVITVRGKQKTVNGLKAVLHRLPDEKEISLYIYPGGEVFSCSYHNTFERPEFGYDEQYKLEALNEILGYARFYLQTRNYHEELYAINNKLVYKKLIVHKDARIGTYTAQKEGGQGHSCVPFGYLLHFFCKKTVITPPPVLNNKS